MRNNARAWRRTATAAGAVIAALVMSPSVAFAALDPTQQGGGDAQGGLWYVSQQGIDRAHAEGHKGQGVKVAIIDSRINPDLPELTDAKITVREPSYCQDPSGVPFPATTTIRSARHGSSMAALIVGNGVDGGIIGVAPEAEILYYNSTLSEMDFGAKSNITEMNACSLGGTDEDDAFGDALAQAAADGADIISISIANGTSELGQRAVLDALRAGIVIITAYPNDESAVADDLTLMANGTLAAMAYDAAGELRPLDKPNAPATDAKIDIVAPGVDIRGFSVDDGASWSNKGLASGNSNATALTAGMIAVVMSKYPNATPNQIIQSVLRNTEQGNPKLVKDPKKQWGYGKFDLTKTLTQDPSQYPDENPLLSTAKNAEPTYEEVTGRTGPKESTAPVQETNPAPSTETSTSISPTILTIGAVTLLAAITITAILVVRTRRKKATQPVAPYMQYPPGGPSSGGSSSSQFSPAPMNQPGVPLP